jgi:8-oxo-dGTP diphosphatase
MQFGMKDPLRTPFQRTGVYAVIRDASRFAAVSSEGRIFLPGGGEDEGETPEMTLRREVREECAREIVIHRSLGTATQYFSAGLRYTELKCIFYEASFGAELNTPPEHELFWLDETDVKALFHEAHAWAVRHCAVQSPLLRGDGEV